VSEGQQHPGRNAQVEQINEAVKDFQSRGQPAISIDGKKKDLIGDVKNGGREWRPKGRPEEEQVYDFIDKERGKATPYGAYNIARDEG